VLLRDQSDCLVDIRIDHRTSVRAELHDAHVVERFVPLSFAFQSRVADRFISMTSHNPAVCVTCTYGLGGGAVQTYGIRELQRRSSEIVDELERSRRPALVTRHGKPVAVLSPIDEDALEDCILASAPEYVASMAEADEDGRSGCARPLADVVAELEGTDGA